MYAAGPQPARSGSLDDYDETPFADYLDGDTSLDFDEDDLGGQSMMSGLPGDLTEAIDGNGRHEKRKNSDIDGDDETGDLKRKEGDDKQPKKPGRKPLMSEPTTKRKAQNRAAQRAFRERKEQHLKNLEVKVEELTKTSEEKNQENGLLKAQVDRLQAELRDYRKRLSSDASRNRSPPLYKAEPPAETFAFEFPTFGSLPGNQLLGTFGQSNIGIARRTAESSSSPVDSARISNSRKSSGGKQVTPDESVSRPATKRGSQESSYDSVSFLSNKIAPTQSNGVDSFAGLFSPGLLQGAKIGTENNDYGFPMLTASPTAQAQPTSQDNGTDSNSGLSRVFRFNSGSASSNTDSPSQSSLSQFNATSSCHTSPCNTSPEPSTSTLLKDTKQTTNYSNINLDDTSNINALNNVNPNQGIDWLAAQNGGQFDPVLFGDYRESQDAIVGDGDFTNGFFNDAFPFEFGSPLNFDLTSPKVAQSQIPASTLRQTQQAQPPNASSTTSASASALANAEKIREGFEDEIDRGCPHARLKSTPTAPNMLNANTIWNQLQNNKDFQDGKFDLDNLCSELRAKAKCSESGVVVPAADVDKVFEKLSSTNTWDDKATLMWQKDHVDDAVKRLGGSGSNWGGMGL